MHQRSAPQYVKYGKLKVIKINQINYLAQSYGTRTYFMFLGIIYNIYSCARVGQVGRVASVFVGKPGDRLSLATLLFSVKTVLGY